jgi:hypothetical protein
MRLARLADLLDAVRDAIAALAHPQRPKPKPVPVRVREPRLPRRES